MDGQFERRRWLDRWMPWIVVALACAVAVSIAMGIGAYLANQERVDQINQERQRNIAAGCRLASNQNEAIIRFLKTGGARESTIRLARESFPVLSDAECERQARSQVARP